MANPLSPISSASLNRRCIGPNSSSGSNNPLNKADSNDQQQQRQQQQQSDAPSTTTASSSPFESTVSGATGRFAPAPASPSKGRMERGAATAAQPFEIRQDTDSDGPTFSTLPTSPSQRAAATQYRFGDRTASPQKSSTITQTNTPIFKKPLLPASHHDNDYDNRSIMSDDTCFSNFSAVPNADMTLFSKLVNRSPTRRVDAPTPIHSQFATPATTQRKRGASPTPRRQRPSSRDDGNDTTNLLLDFTSDFSMSKSTTEPNLLSYINSQRNPSPSKSVRTPASHKMLILLDFELPPQPTPRSVPSITVREVESLKSTYLSEISSLKASLSGREAEVASLKKAVADAERRVGEAMENAREEKNRAEAAEHEKAEWEKKGSEIEQVLKSVKEEFLQGEREKEELQQRLEDSNRGREEAELRLAEACRTTRSEVDGDYGGGTGDAAEMLVAQRVAQQLDEKMENLARELHAVYKKKHETKVATLKKTYEARAEKKCHELHVQVEQLSRQVEELQTAKDSTLSGEIPGSSAQDADRAATQARLEAQKSELEEQRARIAGLQHEMYSMQSSHAGLLQELERERVEKGELVAAVDEMLLLQAETGAPPPPVEVVEDFRRSISRPTGLRSVTGEFGGGGGGGGGSSGTITSTNPNSTTSANPSFGASTSFNSSRIGRPGSSSIPGRSGSVGKSRMMSNIERMGGRGRE